MGGNVPVLPESWMVTKLGGVCEIRDHARIPINAKERDQRIAGICDSELFPYYGATGQVGKIDDYIFEGEHVLVGEDGAPFLEAFKDKAYVVNGRFWVNNHAHILQPTISSKYMCYFLNQMDYSEHVTGTTRFKLNQSALREIPVNFAPANEQQRIVAKLEELFSDLDKGVESLKRAREQLKTYRQAVLKHAFEGKLTAEWRVANADKLETADHLLGRIQTEREARYRQQLKEWKAAVKAWNAGGEVGRKPGKPKAPKNVLPLTADEVAALPELAHGWSWCRLADLASTGTGVTPLKSKSEFYENGTIPWVTSGALNQSTVQVASDFVTESALEETNLRLYPVGTLLLAMYGEGKTRGKSAELRIEATTNQAIAAILVTGPSEPVQPYLKWFLAKNYADIRRLSSGGVQPNLNLGIVENTLVPLCSLQEQVEVCEALERQVSQIDQLEQTIDQSLQQAETLRQSILKKAFSGQLVPQDPNDEPASRLLERIRAEKAAQAKPGRGRKAQVPA